MRGLILFILFLFACAVQAPAQTRAELERRKKQLQEEIQLTNRLLDENQRNTKASLNELYTLKRQIQKREELLLTMQEEIRLMEDQLLEINHRVTTLQEELDLLKDEYARMIRFAHKNQSSYQKLMFVFAAEDFNQAYKRLKYLQQYSSYRKKQAEFIVNTQEELSRKVAELEIKRQEKNQLLLAQQQEQQTQEKQRARQDRVVGDLKNEEKKLKAELRQKQRAERQLAKAIEDIIKKEIEEARLRAEAERKNTGSSTNISAEDARLSDNFAANKGRLSMPVSQGIITREFGQQPHPILKGIVLNNNGVDIRTQEGSQVHCVSEGTVAGVWRIPEYNLMIMVNHGPYRTIYANLKESYVKSGDKVAANQLLGVVFTDPADKRSELHFEIWKDFTVLNPTDWIKRR